MKDYTVEELQQRAKNRVQEWKDTIPGYREQILEQLIEQEMLSQASRYNSDLDYHERQKEWEEQQKHANAFKCACTAIRELLK